MKLLIIFHTNASNFSKRKTCVFVLLSMMFNFDMSQLRWQIIAYLVHVIGQTLPKPRINLVPSTISCQKFKLYTKKFSLYTNVDHKDYVRRHKTVLCLHTNLDHIYEQTNDEDMISHSHGARDSKIEFKQ